MSAGRSEVPPGLFFIDANSRIFNFLPRTLFAVRIFLDFSLSLRHLSLFLLNLWLSFFPPRHYDETFPSSKKAISTIPWKHVNIAHKLRSSRTHGSPDIDPNQARKLRTERYRRHCEAKWMRFVSDWTIIYDQNRWSAKSSEERLFLKYHGVLSHTSLPIHICPSMALTTERTRDSHYVFFEIWCSEWSIKQVSSTHNPIKQIQLWIKHSSEKI